MGLFGDLINKETKKLLKDVLKAQQTAKSDNGQKSDRRNVPQYGERPEPPGTVEALRDRIRSVIMENYSGYEVQENVPSGQFGKSQYGRAYDFVLMENGRPKLMILVLNGRNDYKYAWVREAHRISKEQSAKCMNVMTYLPSTAEYINETIKKNLS